MNATVSRRAFVGSVAAGIPLVVGVPSESFTESSTSGSGHRHGIAGTPDVMFDHAARQLAAIVNRVGRRGASGEDARLVAAHFSMLAVYAQQANLDARMAAAMRDQIRANGRSERLEFDLDLTRMRPMLERYGIAVDQRLLDVPRPNRKTQQQAIDDLATQGLTGMLSSIGSTFDRTAAELDRHGRRPAGIRLIQDSSQLELCLQLWADVERLTAQAIAACAAMVGVPQIDLACVIAEMSLLVMLSIYAAMCL